MFVKLCTIHMQLSISKWTFQAAKGKRKAQSSEDEASEQSEEEEEAPARGARRKVSTYIAMIRCKYV